MIRIAGAPLLLLALSFVGCESEEPSLLPLFGTPAAIETLRSAPTVTAQLLDGESYHRDKSSDYETRGEPVELTPDQAQRLRNLLLDSRSYNFEIAKGCEPNYGVRIRFQDDSTNYVEALLCFQCDILSIYRDGDFAGLEDFDRISVDLASLMKELFPDDETIGSL